MRSTKPSVVLGKDAREIEVFAAQELCRYLEALYGIGCVPAWEPAAGTDQVYLVGSTETNPAGPESLRSLSDQGILLKSITFHDIPGLLVGGGSPRAVLWAVYALAERLGVRYLLHGDVLPRKPPPLPSRLHVTAEPAFPIRWWRTINDFACGPESWGIKEHRRVIDQLAKLKFNRIFLSTWPYQPFVDLKHRGVERRSATLWFGRRYNITDDMPGRRLFSGEEEFWNPDLPRNAPYEEMTQAAQRLAHSIMDYAKRRGMSSGITASLLEFPKEFAPFLKDPQPAHSLADLTVVPGPEQNLDDPGLTDLALAVVRSTLQAYPKADFLLVGMPEFRQWTGSYQEAWRRLDERYGLEDCLTLEEVLERAKARRGYVGGGDRAISEVKGDIVGLQFYDRIFNELGALDGSPDVALVYTSVSEELFPLLGRILPPSSEVLAFVDYTSSRILRRKEALSGIERCTAPASLILTLHDDNVGLLPQLTAGSIAELLDEMGRQGWKGFSTRYWLLGDHDLSVATISRRAWDPSATKEEIFRDHLEALCGEARQDVASALEEVEAVTRALELDEIGLGLTFPAPGMMAKHWTPAPFPPELSRYREGYRRALTMLRQAFGGASAPPPFATYWIGRLEFGVGYLDAVEGIRKAAASEMRANQATGPEAIRLRQQALEEARGALEAVRTALEAYASVAVDRSDLGAIATMGEYVWRWLKGKVEDLEKEERD